MVGAMSASTARQSLVRAAQDGQRRWFFGGGLHIWNATADDADGARLLCLHTPGCCQAFYWDASEPVRTDDSRGIDAGPVDFGRVQASAQKNGGIEILGPPPFSQVAQV